MNCSLGTEEIKSNRKQRMMRMSQVCCASNRAREPVSSRSHVLCSLVQMHDASQIKWQASAADTLKALHAVLASTNAQEMLPEK